MKKPDSTNDSSEHHNEPPASVVTTLRARGSASSDSAMPDIDLDELRAAIEELPELNATKVVALHRRIINGDYKVDSERLAKSIIALESTLEDK